MKPFKSNKLPDSMPDSYFKKGVFFKSQNDVSTYYLIELCETPNDGNAMVQIYSTDIPENHFKIDGLENGCEVSFPELDTELLCEVNLWGKYFFPKFNNEMQLYYDDEKYYKGKCKSNSITSLFECINYAIEYGLKTGGIIPY